MVVNPDRKLMTPQEYLDWEEQQPIKYEYINGKVFARNEEALGHNSIIINLASALNSHTRGKGCRVFMIGAKLGGKWFFSLSRCGGNLR